VAQKPNVGLAHFQTVATTSHRLPLSVVLVT
jgi:hypothetical protein